MSDPWLATTASSPVLRVRLVSAALTAAVVLMGACRPAEIQTRPGEVLPLVAIEINNTATQSDDYAGTTGATDARIRILNADTIDVDVPVTLKNVDFQGGPDLRFAASGTPNSSSLTLTLPEDGAWVPFVLRGVSSSARDKDAIIEVLESRTDGIVLARKALMVGAAPTAGPEVVIRIEGTSSIDDYMAWRPMRASVRLASPSTADVAVRIRNMAPTTAGQLLFGEVPAVTSTGVSPPTMLSQLDLTLPASGDGVAFQVSGDFGFPSANDKDAVLEVVEVSSGDVLGREGMMVRVRKNANTLSSDERIRFLEALARLNMTLTDYAEYQQVHSIASSQAHGGPAFMPWHRAFVVRIERELQAIDPGVALAYWRFDEPAPNVFTTSFMGGNGTGVTTTFTSGHPLSTWTINGLSGIARDPLFSPSESARTPINCGGTFFTLVATETATLTLGTNFPAFEDVEQTYHDGAHLAGGGFSTCDPGTGITGGGWLTYVNLSVRDPLFFMLHSNVDRIWAKWQWVEDRDDPAEVASYSPQGAFPSTGATEGLGHYARDQMWPWDGRTGTVVSGQPLSNRPSTAPGGPLPVPVGPWSQASRPRPADVIDYDGWAVLGTAGLGYGYDDVPFDQ